MRAWMCGTLLVGAAVGGVVLVFAGVGTPSHCGPCLPGPAPDPCPPEAGPVGEPVTDVVDLAAALSAPPPAPSKPFVSFDEPPLARREPPGHLPGPGVVQATFVSPLTIHPEPAPMPRPIRSRGALPLFSPADPF